MFRKIIAALRAAIAAIAAAPQAIWKRCRETGHWIREVVSMPGQMLGGLFGGGVPALGADACADGAADAGAQTFAGQDPARAKRGVQQARQLASAVRGAAACRADALDDSNPEQAFERDRGLPTTVTGWLDHLSIDELRVIARLPSEDILTIVNGGQVMGVRPIGTRELGIDCVAVWAAAALAEETDRNEALRLAMGRAPAVPAAPAGPDADMAALHALDQSYRARLQLPLPSRSSVAERIRVAQGRREERERTPPSIGGMTVH